MVLTVVFVAAIAAPPAFAAEPQWLLGGSAIEGTSSIDTDIASIGKVLLEDMGGTAGIGALCKITGLMFVLSKGASEISTLECTEAESIGGSCTSPKVSPVHLPWTGQLLGTEEGQITGDITGGTEGEPGWVIECTLVGIKITDTCTTNKSSALMKNAAEGIVEAEFMETVAEEEQYDCTVGGQKSGLFAGTETLDGLVAGVLVPLTVSIA